MMIPLLTGGVKKPNQLPTPRLQIQGLILLGTSMDYESSASRAQGCWDPAPLLTPFLDKWSAAAPSSPGQDDEEFVVDEVWCDMVGSLGFGDHATPETRAFWTRTLREVYRGAAGRAKLRMALVNLLSRDGLLLRLGDVRCPVHWLQVCWPTIDASLRRGFLFSSTRPRSPRIIIRSVKEYDGRTDGCMDGWMLIIRAVTAWGKTGHQRHPVWHGGACRADQAVHCGAEDGTDACAWRWPLSERHEPCRSRGCYTCDDRLGVQWRG